MNDLNAKIGFDNTFAEQVMEIAALGSVTTVVNNNNNKIGHIAISNRFRSYLRLRIASAFFWKKEEF